MDIINIDQTEKKPHVHPIFTAPQVTVQELLPGSDEFRINIVNFGKGVRNKWHYHSTEQVLIVTAGTGIVATEQEERNVKIGDVIRIPAGVKHWHGATEDSEFSHMYVMLKDGQLTQVED